MHLLQLIRKDHATVKALFRRFEKADRTSERQKLGQEIIEELSVHELIESGALHPEQIISHRLPLAEAARGYDVFNSKEEKCRKVVLYPH